MITPQGFHAIVQRWPVDSRVDYCRGYVDLPLARPTRVVIAADLAAAPSQERLLSELRSALARLAGAAQQCDGPGGVSCWATSEPEVRNLLVVVTSSSPPSPELEAFVDDWLSRGLETLGVIGALSNPDEVLPDQMRKFNALRWERDPVQVLPDLVDEVLLLGEDRRIFISYARADGSQIADRVFDCLERRRFEVFLDRFRLSPGVDFVERIQDEILDKSMVVVIETDAALASDWVKREIEFASGRRLGLAAVNIAGSAVATEIDEMSRCRVNNDDAIAGFIVDQHRAQLLQRREALRESMYQALRDAGVYPSQIIEAPHGLVVDRAGLRTIIGISVRPADLHRFRLSAEQAAGAAVYIVHPQPMLHGRRMDLEWLSGVSNVIEVDEGRMDEAAEAIA
jgi:hypothetical protein